LTNIISLDGTSDGEQEAVNYEKKMKSIPEEILPRDSDGFPVFDLALVGVGDDGHIGSLYPNRGEIDVVDGPWIVPAFMKDPPSISLTLPVMQRAKFTSHDPAGEHYSRGFNLLKPMILYTNNCYLLIYLMWEESSPFTIALIAPNILSASPSILCSTVQG